MKHIEIFEQIPEAPLDAPPLLFIHGARLGAWCLTPNVYTIFTNFIVEIAIIGAHENWNPASPRH